MTSSELAGSPAAATVIAAARALAGAGQWDLAAELLTSTGQDDPPVRLVLADLAVDQDFWLGTAGAAAALASARKWPVRPLTPGTGGRWTCWRCGTTT